MVYDYYSPVGGTALPFTALKESEQRPEVWTKRPTIPAASMAKAVDALACMLCTIIKTRQLCWVGFIAMLMCVFPCVGVCECVCVCMRACVCQARRNWWSGEA